MTKEMKRIIETKAPADSFKYQMLDRLRCDCNYFLGNGNRSENHLWSGNVAAHIADMKALYDSFPDGETPEWLTMEQIEEYEKQMQQ